MDSPSPSSFPEGPESVSDAPKNLSPSAHSSPFMEVAQTTGKINIRISEQFWSLVIEADRKFSRVRDLPLFGRCWNDEDFQKAFSLYTQLWKLQQQHRQRLVEAGMQRWEIGEIAGRIAQLYHGLYQRTSNSSYLADSYLFYEAILSREYFRDTGGSVSSKQKEIALASKQLRFLARFLIVCLKLGRRDMVSRLVGMLRALLDDYKKSFQEAESKESRRIVEEAVRFLKFDTPFMNMRPLRYSFVFDVNPDFLRIANSSCKRRRLVLRDAILSSYWHNEAKFAELTLDTFRMLQSVEWEPSGRFAMRTTSDSSHTGSKSVILNDIRDAELPPNPRKLILHRPSVTHFLMVLATICEELPDDGIMLLYLSAKGGPEPGVPLSRSDIMPTDADDIAENFSNFDISSSVTSPCESPSHSLFVNKENSKVNSVQEGGLWFGSCGSGGSNYIYPCDLIPFTRKPLLLVIDSNTSHAFKAIHGQEKGETTAMLLSPASTPASVFDFIHHQHGSFFTLFLTAPVQAFCSLIGISDTNIDRTMFEDAEELLSRSLNKWESTLLSSYELHPVWIEALGDPFLRRFLLRFIFSRAVLALHASTSDLEEFLPTCIPDLPELVGPKSPISQASVMLLANLFGAVQHFVFTG